jgi:type IV fimbrial biogenesis protein FimT
MKSIPVPACGPVRNRGFTAIELLMVVAILGVLAALAAPSFTETIKRYRVNSIREDLFSSIQWARSEAVRRRVPVTFARITGCGASLTTADDWDCGWNAFVDTNNNSALDAGEPILRSFTIPTGYRLTHNAAVASTTMIVTRFGQPGTASERFIIAPPEGSAGAATLVACYYPGGSLRSAKGTPACNTF